MRRREFIAALGGAAVWPLAMRIGVIGIIALMLAAVTQSVAEDTATAQPTPAEPTAVAPYLKPEQRPDIGAILSLAPQKGSVAFETDRAIFRATRALKGTPYWELAIHDVRLDLPTLVANFDCALGTNADLASTPALVRVLSRSLRDTYFATDAAKRANKRARPFTIDDGPVCEPIEHLNSYDYPSGHSTVGWTVGLILAELAPDRATDILVRSRGYAANRVICGAHNQSAVEAGKTVAVAIIAVLHSSPEFRNDMADAGAELAVLRKRTEANPEICKTEREILSGERDLFDRPPF
jgi:acid phosphatase (class A)